MPSMPSSLPLFSIHAWTVAYKYIHATSYGNNAGRNTHKKFFSRFRREGGGIRRGDTGLRGGVFCAWIGGRYFIPFHRKMKLGEANKSCDTHTQPRRTKRGNDTCIPLLVTDKNETRVFVFRPGRFDL